MEKCTRTERERYAELLGGRPRARILIVPTRSECPSLAAPVLHA